MKAERKRLAYLEGYLSVIFNSALFGFKLWVGMAAGSIAMIADGWHTLSDTLTSFVVILGFWIAGKPRDEEHPFGHGRAEVIGTIIIGTMLSLVGFNFLKESYFQLRDRQTVVFTRTAIVVFIISILIKEALAQFSLWAGRKIDSKALTADGWHHRSDALASALIVLGALLGRSIWWMDGVLGIVVSLLILYAAFDIIKDSGGNLMGEVMDSGLQKTIADLVSQYAPEVTDIHHIHMHRYGDHIEITLHAKMPKSYSLERAHEISNQLEERLRSKLKVEPTIHLEPRED